MERLRRFLQLLTPHVEGSFPLSASRETLDQFQLLYSNKYAQQQEGQMVFFKNRRFWQIPLDASSGHLNRKDQAVLAARVVGPKLNSQKVGLMIFHSPFNPKVILLGVSSNEEPLARTAHEVVRAWALTGKA